MGFWGTAERSFSTRDRKKAQAKLSICQDIGAHSFSENSLRICPLIEMDFALNLRLLTPDDRRQLCFSFFISTTFVKMKLNISYPANGTQKLIEVDDERKLRVFMDRRMGQEVPGDSVGDEFKGYIFKITGGNDKQGFPMKQGVMHPTRVRLLLADGHSCYRPRRTGERKRKSVRGCIVGMDLSVLALSIVKQGDAELPGLTDTVHPKRLGPKRATKIRRFFGLSKEDDVSFLIITSPILLGRV